MLTIIVRATEIPAWLLERLMGVALRFDAGKAYQRIGRVWGAYLQALDDHVCSRFGHRNGGPRCLRCGKVFDAGVAER